MTHTVKHRISVHNLGTMDIVMINLEKIGFDLALKQLSPTEYILEISSEDEMTAEHVLSLGILIGQIQSTH